MLQKDKHGNIAHVDNHAQLENNPFMRILAASHIGTLLCHVLHCLSISLSTTRWRCHCHKNRTRAQRAFSCLVSNQADKSDLLCHDDDDNETCVYINSEPIGERKIWWKFSFWPLKRANNRLSGFCITRRVPCRPHWSKPLFFENILKLCFDSIISLLIPNSAILCYIRLENSFRSKH